MSAKEMRRFTIDSPSRPYMRDAAGPARRTLICSFKGSAFVAEREGDELKIYAVTGEPFATSAIGDARPRGRMTIADLQALHEKRYPRHESYAK
jgi:hypothetical protein